MVQAASLLNQLLQHSPRTEFAALVKKHHCSPATAITLPFKGKR